jgi:FlaA1/EpsC-like NDP-sugar epimerase
MATMLWLYLVRIEMPSSWLSERRSVALAVPAFLSRVAGRVGALVLDAVMLMLSMYFSFLFRFDSFSWPRPLAGAVLFAGALSILVRIPLLSLFSGSRLEWRIRSRRDVYPILAASAGGGLMLAGISYYLLPASREIPLALLAVDGVFSAALLLVGRFSHTVFDDFLSEGAGDFHSAMSDSGREFFHHYMDWKQHHGDMIAIGSQNGLASDFLFGIPIEGTADLSRLIARRIITTVYLLPDCSPAAGERITAVCSAHGLSVSALRYSFEAVAAPAAESPKPKDALRQSAIAD